MASGPLTPAQFSAVLAAIDEVNAGDPHELAVHGEAGPKELVHARLVTGWVVRLDPSADQAQLVAARAHHLRRWALPRSSYPDGRAGYLRWRTEAKRRHAEEVGEILTANGAGATFVDRVRSIVRKEGLGTARREATDPAVQAHEDALCLVFLDTQLDALVQDLGPDKAIDVLRRTVSKMSSAAVALAEGLDLTDGGRAALDEALARDAEE